MATNESPSYTLLMNSEFECDEWELNEAWGFIEEAEQPSRGSSLVIKSPLDSQPQNSEAIELDHMYHRKDSDSLTECRPESLDSPISVPTLLGPSGPEPMDDLVNNPVDSRPTCMSLIGSITGLDPLHMDSGPIEPDSDHYERNGNNETDCPTELRDPETAINIVAGTVGSVSPTDSFNSLHMDLDNVEPGNDHNWHESNSEKNQNRGGGLEDGKGGTCFSVQDQDISDDLSVSGKSENRLKQIPTKESGKLHDRMVLQVDHSYSRGSALCEICGSFFADQCALEKHATEHILERSDISPPQKYKCTYCDYIAKDKTSFRNHQNLHILSTDLVCVCCGTLFLQQETLKQHKCNMKHVGVLKSVPQNRQTTCVQNVGNIAQEEERILQNSRREMVGKLQQRQSKDSILQMSQESKHQVYDEHTCRYCEYMYIVKDRTSLKNPQNPHAGSLKQDQSSTRYDPYAGTQPYLCECCGCSFIQKRAFTVHMAVHRFMDTEAYGHKSFNMDASIPETIKCQICDKEFDSESKLLRHENLHRGENRRPVSKRKKADADGGNDSTESEAKIPRSGQEGSIGQQELGWTLTIYGTDGEPIIGRKGKSQREGPTSAPKRKWAIESPFDSCDCSMCGKTFAHPFNLKLHITKKHSGFYCDKCDVLGFSSREELKNHLLKHSEQSIKYVGLTEKGPKLSSTKKPESSPAKQLKSVVHVGRSAKGSNKSVESGESNERNAKSSRTKDSNPLQSGQTNVSAPVRKISTVADTRFHCNLCGDKFFTRASNLKIHIRETHSGFYCDKCNVLGFSSRKEYVKHLLTHREQSKSVGLKKHGPKLPAPKEKTKSSSEKEPKSIKSGQPEVRNKSSTAKVPTKSVHSSVSKGSTKSLITKQLKSVQSGQSKCNKTNTGRQAKGSNKSTSAKELMSVESGESNGRNAKSSSWTKDSNHLQSGQKNVSAQVRKVSSAARKRVYCKRCDRDFSRPWRLKKHMDNTHVHRENFFCDKCDRLSFPSSAELAEHMKSHSNPVSHICDECLFAFGSQKSLEKHKTMHHLTNG